jgi:hypothetical protein
MPSKHRIRGSPPPPCVSEIYVSRKPATTRRANTMKKTRTRTVMFALLTICISGVLLPTDGFASLNSIACRAIKRGCYGDCAGGSDACYGECDKSFASCMGFTTTRGKQQTPPPSCTGIRCTLPIRNPPTTVSDPVHPPRHPIGPVKPVGISNPGNTNTGNSGPVILLRKNAPGDHGHGH